MTKPIKEEPIFMVVIKGPKKDILDIFNDVCSTNTRPIKITLTEVWNTYDCSLNK